MERGVLLTFVVLQGAAIEREEAGFPRIREKAA